MRSEGRYVLYWMIAARRPAWNFALDRAIELAREAGRPLLVLEALRVDDPFASARIHRFVLEGMRANAAAFAGTPVRYVPYVEPCRGAGRGLVEALSVDACAVVTDQWPWLFVPRMTEALARRVAVRVEAVDSCGLLPLRAAKKAFARAFDFRRFLQRELPAHLDRFPRRRPLARLALAPPPSLPRSITSRWRPANRALLEGRPAALAALPIDHSVTAVPCEGGHVAGTRRLARFLSEKLGSYAEEQRHPDAAATSGLSSYLHFGHVGAHQVFAEVAQFRGWNSSRLPSRASGKREGWWGMGPSADAFLDQLVTWRELGLNGAAHDPRAGTWASLPEWARLTLERHAGDPRERLYTLAELEGAGTHDELWNAAQRELLEEGRIHNYLRMLWGKRVLGWTRDPRGVLERLFHLNDRWALDGRDPNSMSGISWILGRYDRAWGPERPVFGTVRYMTSESTRRKLHLSSYLERYGTGGI